MIILDVAHGGRTRRITSDRDQLTIGRGRSADVKVDEPGIGERHCSLILEAVKRKSRRGKKWVLSLQDHQISDVPTLVNGIEVIRTQIESGDVIKVGELRVRVVDAGPADAIATTPAAPVRETPTAAPAPQPTPEAAPRPPVEDDEPHVPYLPAPRMEPQPRRRTTKRGRAVDPDAMSPGASRAFGWLVAGMAAAIAVLVFLIASSGNTKKNDSQGRKTASREGMSAADLKVFGNRDPRIGGASANQARGAGGESGGLADPGDRSLEAEADHADAPTAGESTAGRTPGASHSAGGANDPANPGSAAPVRTGPTLPKREIYRKALEADQLARENDFPAAASRYRDLTGRADETRLVAELNDHLVDLERLTGAREELVMRLAAASGAGPEIRVRGAKVRVVKPLEKNGACRGIVVDMNGEVGLPWKNVPPRGMATLFTWAFPDAEGLVLRGVYLFLFKADFEKDPPLEQLCHASFQKALKRAPERIQEVNAVLGRGLGVTSATGFVYHDGRFMTPERRDRLASLATARKQIKNLSSGKAEVRRAAYAHLHAVNDLEMHQLFRRVLEARRRSLAKSLAESATGKKLLALRAEKEKFLAKRKECMDMIFDTHNYPYPFRPERGASQEAYARYLDSQKKIDDVTRVLWKIWKSTKGQVGIGKAFVSGYEVLREVQVELDKFRGDEVEPATGLTWIVAIGDLPFWKKFYRNKITLAALPMDLKERERVEYYERTLVYNAALESPATKPEKQQVEVTNHYRHLMGRRALMLNNKLLDAARGHSRDMVLKGYFSHHAPDPERRTPQQRMKLAGYQLTGGSENIARGASGPEAVHERWRHSSGHHRNILGPNWLELGSGNVGSFWTQNFGTRGVKLPQVLAEQKGDEKTGAKKRSRT